MRLAEYLAAIAATTLTVSALLTPSPALGFIAILSWAGYGLLTLID